jgi:hypothetical protein
MKKIVLYLFLTGLFTQVSAPPPPMALVLPITDPINPHIKLMYAVGIVETGNDTLAYNALEEATGWLQVRPIRLEDYNKRTGKNYSLKDCYSKKISIEIFLYYASKFEPYETEQCARAWNGSGEMTNDYWMRVKTQLVNIR